MPCIDTQHTVNTSDQLDGLLNLYMPLKWFEKTHHNICDVCLMCANNFCLHFFSYCSLTFLSVILSVDSSVFPLLLIYFNINCPSILPSMSHQSTLHPCFWTYGGSWSIQSLHKEMQNATQNHASQYFPFLILFPAGRLLPPLLRTKHWTCSNRAFSIAAPTL